MEKLDLKEMEQIKAKGCLEYATGVALIVAGGLTGNPALGYVGFGIGFSNARSCASQFTS
ncbi:hypothetical protein NC796_18190 [Aliifodinibius sp. S!AR15-10]|uniref:hypothetical protein n=1 Tax=Aliifodinibius sp. S!AR15-10 TaxID=2950437 RepID=UPI00285B734B|nr:hypothetical protein [Aliifodinibius sp. S!AR15-10]MDR8393092.1 hypothetical protein [Aliifodinibius sp. S!AR15-10]